MSEVRAVVLEKFNEPLVMKTFPVPDLKEGEVLVKIEAAGVCGSDVHMWEGRDPRTPASHDPWATRELERSWMSTEKKGMSMEDLLKGETRSYGTGG